MNDEDIEIDGLGDAGEDYTDFARAVGSLEQLGGRIGQSFEAMSGQLEAFTKRLDEAAAQTKKATAEKAAPKADPVAEAQALRARAARLVGGGVNYAAYEQQLQKVRDQMGLINQAEEKQIISHKEALASLSKLQGQYLKLSLEAKAYAAVGGGGLGRIAATMMNRTTALPGQAVDAAKNQIAGIGTGLMGLVQSTPIGGGLFGLMLHGHTNQDRINAETGEIVNIAVAASGKLSQSAQGFLGSFQQQAEHYFGISRQEVQGVLKTFVDAGVSIEDIMKKQKANLGLVGHDVMTLTLGIDKHFELASGTSARTVVSLMQDYGQSVEQAGDLYERLAFAGSRSGMGVQNFVNYVMQGSSAIRQYGAGVENVATVLLKLQQSYESMGVPKQLAGTLAGQGLGQITQGMSSMSTGMQAYFGERMGMGTGLEARMNFRDGMQRIAKEGASNEFTTDFIREAYKTAIEASGGDKTQARFFLEQQGFGFEGARAIMEIGEKVDKGAKVGDLSIKEQKSLRDAFKTEGQKTSDIQKHTHTILQGMADVGQGILQIVSNFVAIAIVFFKTMPALFMGTDAEKKATLDVIKGFYDDIGAGAKKMWEGSKGIGHGVYGMMAPIIKPLEQAIGWNPYGINANVSTFRVGQAGKAAEQAELDRRFGGVEAGKSIRQISDKMQQSENATIRSMAGTVDDVGILTTGFSTALARGFDWAKEATGLGEDRMRAARERGMAEERAQIAKENAEEKAKRQTGIDMAPKPEPKPARNKIDVVVKPAYAQRPSTPAH